MKLKAIISGGGTGGHIFPALAIANELKAIETDSEILFVGAKGRMEMEKVPAAGYQIIGLPVTGMPRKPGLKLIKFVFNLIFSVIQARKIINNFHPNIVIGVGGYASGPVLRAASRKRIPTLIQEQNSYAGITNKLLSRKVNKICVAYEQMSRFFPEEKIIITGNPIRKDLINISCSKKEARDYFKIKEGKKILLIIGGSLGARSINNTIIDNLESITKSGVILIWQTGALYFDEMILKSKNKAGENVKIYKFLTRMDLAYRVSDLVISRAGAGTISELCVVGKPSILVPSPNVAEDHQTKNALSLVKKGAAVLVRDNEINTKLFPEAFDIINDQDKLKSLSVQCKKLAKPEATENIVKEILNMINK